MANMAGVLMSQQLTQSTVGGEFFWQLLYSLFMFGLVVLLSIVVTRLWVKKGAGIATGPKKHLRLLEHLPLGAGKGLCLVKVLDSVLLVSITDKAITVLQEFPMTPEFEIETTTATNNIMSLPGWLARVLQSGKGASDTGDQTAPLSQQSQNFAHELQERLRRLKEPKV